jgi:hypothetical protein
VLLRHDAFMTPSAVADVATFLSNGHFPIARFWRD